MARSAGLHDVWTLLMAVRELCDENSTAVTSFMKEGVLDRVLPAITDAEVSNRHGSRSRT